LKVINHKIVLAARPKGMPVPSDFRTIEETLTLTGERQILIQHEALGLAPSARLRMRAETDSYAAPMAIGETVYGQAVGRIVGSSHPDFKEGEWVMAMGGSWQRYFLSNGDRVFKIDVDLAPPAIWLGALGTSGLAAWIGLREIGRPNPGETVVVSAATGAVGSSAAQMAKAWGCKVVGIAGGLEKCLHATQYLGLDACVDYRDPNFPDLLATACSDGIDVYFDNVGGKVRDAVWARLNQNARVAVCGLISEYNSSGEREPGPPWFDVLVKQLTVRGFLLRDQHLARRAEFVAEVGELYRAGSLRVQEEASRGLERVPDAFIAMLRGGNLGKTVVYLDD
jgi:NADPH-dependent curcumin reductase CurA